AKNDVLLQLQADALGLPVERPAVLEAGALGAAWLAGLATGVWAGTDDLRACWRRERLFDPRLGPAEREGRFAAWRRHVRAALAAAELVGASGERVLRAAVAGYDVAARLAMALGPAAHYRRGFHLTATCGAFGAAAAAGAVLGLDAAAVAAALGIAGSQAAG